MKANRILAGLIVVVVLAVLVTAVAYLVAGDAAWSEAAREDRATHACWVEAKRSP